MTKYLRLILIIPFIFSVLNAGTANLNNYFVPNLGQIENRDVKYITYSNDCDIYFFSNKISFVFKKTIKKLEFSDSLSLYRIDMQINSSEESELAASDPEQIRLNYYLPSCPKGIKDMNVYNELIYQNFKEGVNLHFKFKDKKLSYFIDGNRSLNESVEFKFIGIESISQDNNIPENLKIKSPVGDINLNFANTIITDFSKVNSDKSNFVKFKSERPKTSTDLQKKDSETLLSGDLSWITYMGGSSFDHLYCIDADENADLLLCGLTNSSDFPTTPGSFQPNKNGGEDAIVLKIDKNSKIVWCTFLGGSAADRAINIVKRDSIIWVSGESLSYDFPVTANAHQKNYSGGSADILVMRLDENGYLLHATYHGGGAYDSSPDLAVDSKYNVWLVGRTFSNDFPVTSNAQYPNKGNFYDAFMLSLDKEGNLRYASFFPGDQDVFGEGIAIDSNDNVCITGYTLTENLPVTANAYQKNKHNKYDAYLAKFNNIGKPIWITYFGGNGQDYGSNLTVDPYGNYFIFGFTNSTDLPTNANVFQPNLSGGFDSFIAKFNPDGEFQWVSYFGGSANEGIGEGILYQIGGVKSDKYGNILVSGQTSSSNMPITPDAFQNTLKGQTDAFIAKFDVNGKLIYSTFLGGSSNDRGYDVVIDNEGYLVNVGWTESSDFPVTENAFQKIYHGNIDAYIFRLKECKEFYEFEINIPNDTLVLASQNNSIPVILKFNNAPDKIDNLVIKLRFVEKYYDNLTFSNGVILNTEKSDKYITYELSFNNIDSKNPEIELCKINFNSKLPSDFKTKIEIVDFNWNISCSNTKIKDSELLSECDLPIKTNIFLRDSIILANDISLPLYLSCNDTDRVFIKYNTVFTISYKQSRCELMGVTNGSILTKYQVGEFEECLIKFNDIKIAHNNNMIGYLNFTIKDNDTSNIAIELKDIKWYEPCIESDLLGCNIKRSCNELKFEITIPEDKTVVNDSLNKLPIHIRCVTDPTFNGTIDFTEIDLSISNNVSEVTFDGLNLISKSDNGSNTIFNLSKQTFNMKSGENTLGYINYKFKENQSDNIILNFEKIINSNICYTILSKEFGIPVLCDSIKLTFQIADTTIAIGKKFSRTIHINLDKKVPSKDYITFEFLIKAANRSLVINSVKNADSLFLGFENGLSVYKIRKTINTNSKNDSVIVNFTALLDDADTCQIQLLEFLIDNNCVSMDYPKIALINLGNLCVRNLRGVQFFKRTILEAYPNPATDNVAITVKSIDDGIVIFRILDQMGNKLFEKSWLKEDTSSQLIENLTISLQDYSTGFYVFQLITNNNIMSEKVIINK